MEVNGYFLNEQNTDRKVTRICFFFHHSLDAYFGLKKNNSFRSMAIECDEKSQIVGKDTLPWAMPFFFFKFEENKYFSSYAYCFIFKSDRLNPNFVEKNSYLILFFLESYFFDEQSKFLDVRFY